MQWQLSTPVPSFGELDNPSRPDVPEVSLQLLRENMVWKICLHISFISWIKIDTLYIVEGTQLKLIFETRKITPYFGGNRCQRSKAPKWLCVWYTVHSPWFLDVYLWLSLFSYQLSNSITVQFFRFPFGGRWTYGPYTSKEQSKCTHTSSVSGFTHLRGFNATSMVLLTRLWPASQKAPPPKKKPHRNECL